jgi:hypothetical protein
MKTRLPAATAWAVPYPANMDEDSIPLGVNATVKHVEEQMVACPAQKFAVVGYSQGAALFHVAFKYLPEAFVDKVIASVMFGDPGMLFPNLMSCLTNTGSPGPKSTTPLSEMKNIPDGLFTNTGT